MITMMQEQKIIKNKLGLLKLAETLGSVSQACKVMGFSRDRANAAIDEIVMRSTTPTETITNELVNRWIISKLSHASR